MVIDMVSDKRRNEIITVIVTFLEADIPFAITAQFMHLFL